LFIGALTRDFREPSNALQSRAAKGADHEFWR